ncbi:hypothetical protein Vadar_027247 [Vaccinium darrowii]|uniref:Uncharacterized protein n=1 Tax=Vaccinium darrowii TaxID=229202 RepID=A0ACB7YGE5_9ERIC|nr:hypothetical protein Vadar_027247 [Vaccinium darrowii]
MQEGMNKDKLQRDATTLKQDMPEPTPEAKRIAAEAKVRDDAYRRKDYLVALDAYTQAIDFDPSDATLLSNRSVCWIRLGQAMHALTDAKACRALRPDWSKACYREANSFREDVELDPNNKDLTNAFREAVEAGKKFRGTDQ